MIIWLDAQLPPQLAVWIRSKFLIDATAIRDLAILICETQKTAQYSKPLAKKTSRVGWVERLFRDTHHLHAPTMGIAKPLHPSYDHDAASGRELTRRN